MRRPALNLTLAIGFFSIAAAILAARTAPAGAYEASVYAGTPRATWIALGIALSIAVGMTIATRGFHQAVGIGLGAAAVSAIVAVPVIRNYRFLGMGDGLTHLGWVRDFVAADLHPHELFYPGLHSIASVVHLVGGVPTERAVMLTVLFLFVPFVIFVPLLVRDVTGSTTAAGFAAVFSWMVLPINNVATHMSAHTNSNALFLVPVVLFAFVAYARRREDLESLPLGVSAFGILLLLSGLGLLFVHPQQMINVVVLLAAACGVQFLARRRFADRPLAESIRTHRPVYAHTFALGGFFVLWALSNERFRRALSGLVYGLFSQDIGAGGEVGQRGASLTEIGGSIGELFVKMFLVSAIAGLVAVGLVGLVWLGRSHLDLEGQAFVSYFGAALIPLGGMFLIYFVGTPTMAFRQVGFIFVVVTILAGIALARAAGWLSGAITTPGGSAVTAAFLGACLVLSLLTLFATPYIYNPSQHVTDQQLSGYESTFEHTGDDAVYAGFGTGVERYGDAINGVEAINTSYAGGGEGAVDPEAFNAGDYAGAYHPDSYYFTVTAYDTTREFDVYDELHHEQRALDGLDGYQGANKHVSNGEFGLYTVSEAV